MGNHRRFHLAGIGVLVEVAFALSLASAAAAGADTAAVPPEEPIADFDLEHWSFQPLVRPPVPAVREAGWCRTPVDRFILARLEAEGLRPMPEADGLTLLRRVTYDLTGLPPTIEEIDQFLGDRSADRYERLISRLLASPAYGERWAQHWLDLARFAETDGFEQDALRPQAWRYRDWVIDAFNADMPYDRFLCLQLAGDLISPDDAASQVATGFLLCGPDMPDINLQEERRHTFLNGMAATVGEAFLGLRMGCAQCHHHRTDPISQFDFYRLRAYFDSLDLFEDHPLASRFNDDGKPVRGRVTRETPQSQRDSYLWIRGDFRRQGPPVEAAFPRVVNVSMLANGESPTNAEDVTHKTSGRVALAQWLTCDDNPLTARVIANRMWQHHFGVGMVSTPSDFGLMGDAPTHPDLLDWLASELIHSGWSLKSLHRLIVTSAVYRTRGRPVSEPSADEPSDAPLWTQLVELDPENAWLGRMPRRRLEGEAIRDALLMVAGRLNRATGGPGVRPPLAAEVTATLRRKNDWPVTEDVAEHDRRSIYLFVRRNLGFPLFDVFDKPDTNMSCPERSQTTIAPQALHLLNSEFANACAADFAQRLATAGETTAEQIAMCYLAAYGRPPTTEEQTAAQDFLQQDNSPAALVDLCLALLNTNEFIYID
jgi:hypothetical protein